MSTSSQHPSSSSRDLTLVVESASGTPEEYFAQVALSLGRAKSNTIHIDHPDVDHIHAKVVKREESFWLQCEGQARLQILDPEPGEVGEVELIPGLTIELGGVTIRCRRQMRGMSSLSDDYWADAAGGEQFRVEADSFTGNLPKKIGPYEIRKFVARGGMGIVLQGIHEGTAQPAAVKLPTPDLNKDQEWLKRFEQEVRTLKSVTHPNLVRLQDAGKEGDLHWMAMDWVEGWTVGERLAVYKEAGEPMPMQEIQLVLKQVVEGLITLHAQGVVHRDLKPGNLLVGQDGGVKVADFGLAKQVGGEQSTFLTRTGTFAGTMHYMAPEQAEGGDITPATDVYALGVIWHELLTGKRPGHRLKIGQQRSDCPGSWVDMLGDCLEEESADRPSLSLIQQALMAEEFEAVIPPTELEQEEAPPAAEPEMELEQLPREQLEPESVTEVEEPEPVATVGGYSDGYTAEPESKKSGSKIPLVLCGVVGLAILWALFGGGGSKEDLPPLIDEEVAQATEPATPEPATPEPATPEPTTPEPTTPEPTTPEPTTPVTPPSAGAFVNTLGMKFVPVPGTDVQFCIWETRVKDYAAYAAANSGVDASWKKPSFLEISILQETTHPVVNVSWEDANAFCAWLTKKELAEGKITASQRYRLPTDAEWSVAVGLGKEEGNTPKEKQMGLEDVYPWGKEWPPPKGAGNYADTACKLEFGPKYKAKTGDDLTVIEGYTDGFAYTSPVGSFAANKEGLHDMGGNVWEWCEDWYDPAAKTYRVLRGASWGDRSPDYLLSSPRGYGTPGSRGNDVGFRCVLVGGSGG
jgi:serine/threonine protein kinase